MSQSPEPTILYCAADLIWATRIKATAEALSLNARPVRNADMLTARLADSQIRGLILDLDAGPVAFDLLAQARVATNPIPVVVFGPHVAVDLLERARAGGADQVMPRGAFDKGLPEILKALWSLPR